MDIAKQVDADGNFVITANVTENSSADETPVYVDETVYVNATVDNLDPFNASIGGLGTEAGDPGGGSARGPGRHYYVDLKVLNDCLGSLNIPVQIFALKSSTPGGSGYAIGIGPDAYSRGNQTVPITVTNDAATYNAAQIAQLCNQPGAVGCTPPGNPYRNYTNNNNTAFGTVSTQVHELGHSLFQITAGSAFIPEPGGEIGKALKDCVKQHAGIRRR